ncbi:uncharacterized protein LOC133907176 [Phragmites australis]|uniref:uncharacterized protein LOC133907176 n=1 Tax=Phragmites australis TaxID=29695 RepID=UPI002D774457|nr:uncharacterized protein LOC133907176 [Phragmites australis]
MTGDKEKFRELDEGIIDRVKFGDGSMVQIMGLGSIVFSCKNDNQWLLQEVYYIPRMCINIISLGQLTEVGHKVTMDVEHLRVYDGSLEHDLSTPLPSGSSSTDEGPIHYRHIDDIMRDARRVELDEEDMKEEVMLVETEEPSCYLEAAGQQVWEDAMAKEIESIEKNNTWTLTALPAGHKLIGLKWVYTLKKNT